MLAFSVSSCRKDFLERYPLDNMSDATFFSAPNDLKVYVNGFYPLLPRYHFQNSFDGANNNGIDANSDILISTGPSGGTPYFQTAYRLKFPKFFLGYIPAS